MRTLLSFAACTALLMELAACSQPPNLDDGAGHAHGHANPAAIMAPADAARV